MIDLSRLTSSELLALHSELNEVLRERGILRSANNPTGDLAEHLFCKAFGWKQAGNSFPAADAVSDDGTVYQIKGRRLARANTSRQLSALRGLPDANFDYLAAVLFEADYSIKGAVIIPHSLVLENARYVSHTNSWLFFLRDVVWTWQAVTDVTDELRKVEY